MAVENKNGHFGMDLDEFTYMNIGQSPIRYYQYKTETILLHPKNFHHSEVIARSYQGHYKVKPVMYDIRCFVLLGRP